MSFLTFESSTAGGEPIELYEFTLGSTSYLFCSSEDDYEYSAQTYASIPIGRSSIISSGESRQENLTVEMPSSETLPSLFKASVPDSVTNLSIYRLHRPDGSTPEKILIFKGTVRSVAFTDDGQTAQITVAPISNSLARNIPRYSWQKVCNHFLYDERCKVIANNFRHDGSVSDVSGSAITIPGLEAAVGDGWATAGYVQLGSSDYRMVTAHDGDVLTLLLPFTTDITGLTVSVFAGCDHTPTTCHSKFNNVINYGGSTYVPLKNIFVSGIGK